MKLSDVDIAVELIEERRNLLRIIGQVESADNIEDKSVIDIKLYDGTINSGEVDWLGLDDTGVGASLVSHLSKLLAKKLAAIDERIAKL
jgi:hypothetical protein